MLKIKVCVPEHLSTNCRKLIYLAYSVAEKYSVEVEIEKSNSSDEMDYPKPYIQINDYLLGKNITPENLEKVIIKELKEGQK